MWESGRLGVVEAEMDRYKLEILGLSETRWTGFGEIRTEAGKTLLYAGREEGENHTEGVGFLLTQKARRGLVSWQPVCERIVTARFKTRVRYVTLVQCYAPTENSEEGLKDEFYGKLEQTLRKVKKQDILIIMGDFNAKVGSENTELESIMGKYGTGNRNENGERLIDLCGSYNLVIGGTLFPHRTIHKVTWVSPNGVTQNQIDHILIRKTWRSSLLDTRSKRGADVGSDHHLVIAQLRLKISSDKAQQSNIKRYDVDKLGDPNIKEKFKMELRNHFEALSEEDLDDENAENMWQRRKQVFRKVSESVLGYKRCRRKPWISEDTWLLIEERKRQKKIVLEEKNAVLVLEKQRLYNEKHRQVKRSLRSDKRKWAEALSKEAQIAANTGNSRELYRITKKLANKTFRTEKPVRNKEGTLLLSDEEQIKRWREHFEAVFGGEAEREREEMPNNAAEVREAMMIGNARVRSDPPSRAEIVQAVRQMKNGKAPGIDALPPEIMKCDPQTTADALTPLFQEIWRTEQIPEDWKRGVLVKLPKKGDSTVCDNWRGITLLSIPSKIMTRVILNRITDTIDINLRREQAGFRRNKSCIDLINTLRIVVEQSGEYQTPLYLLFIDFEKAFDSITREAMWKAMESFGLPPKIISISKALYENFQCQVMHKGKLSDPINVTKGVRQGCLLSPIIFLMVLDRVMRKVVQGGQRGIQWGLMQVLEDLDYADDICLLAHRFQHIKGKLKDLIREGSRVGLKINCAKTKEIRMNNNQRDVLQVGLQQVEEVEHFQYLGSIVSRTGGTEEDIRSRINKARGVFAQLRPVWKSREILLHTKLRIFDSNVKSVLLYGCETWKITKQVVKPLQTFLNRCLRSILHIFWPQIISNEELWRRTNQTSVELQIRKRKYGWLGHTLRKEIQEVERQALDWNPQGGARRVGRPRTTWRRTVQAELREIGLTWGEVKALAGNRVGWRAFVDALCPAGDYRR